MNEDTDGFYTRTVKQNQLTGNCKLRTYFMRHVKMKRKPKQNEFPFIMDIRKLVGKPKKIPLNVTLKQLGLPKPDNKYGYNYSTLLQHMSSAEYFKFNEWMNGQTCVLVDGRVICYTEDVVRFLRMVRQDKETYFD